MGHPPGVGSSPTRRRAWIQFVFFLTFSPLKAVADSGGVRFTASPAVPLGQVGHFMCQTTGIGSKPTWLLQYKDGVSQPSFPFYDMSCTEKCVVNQARGIFSSYSATNTSSTLTVNGSEENNGTIVACLKLGGTTSGTTEATFQVYGPPLAPSAINGSHLDLNTLLISWTPGFSPFNVVTFYDIYAMPPAGKIKMIGAGARERQIIFPVSTVCGATEFRVHSSNQAGTSTGFAEENFHSLIISNLMEFRDSISHRVDRQANKIELILSIEKVPTFCPEYTGTQVRISLTRFTPLTSSQDLELDLSDLPARVGLVKDAGYRYSLFVLNNLTIYESGADIYTTDVMGPVLVSVDGKNKVLEVHCEFHDSPTALGCVAYIAENPENPNITSKYFIGRNGSSSAHARINLPPECVNISSSNITVFCWKEDGTVGNTSIPVQVEMKYLGKASSPSVPVYKGTEGLTKHGRQTLVVGAILGGIALIIIVTVVAAISAAFVHYHVRPRRYKKNEVQGVQTAVNRSNTFCTVSGTSCSPQHVYTYPTSYTLPSAAPGQPHPPSYAPSASSNLSSISSHQGALYETIYPSLLGSLARDASPPTPASNSAVHVRFSAIGNNYTPSLHDRPTTSSRRSLSSSSRPTSPYANYDFPHSPAISLHRYRQDREETSNHQNFYQEPRSSRNNFYQQPKSISRQCSYALYDQLPQANGSVSPVPPLHVSAASLPQDTTSLPPTPLPPPLPEVDCPASPDRIIPPPSPEYIAMNYNEECTSHNFSNSNESQHYQSLDNFASSVPFTSSNFLTKALNGQTSPSA